MVEGGQRPGVAMPPARAGDHHLTTEERAIERTLDVNFLLEVHQVPGGIYPSGTWRYIP